MKRKKIKKEDLNLNYEVLGTSKNNGTLNPANNRDDNTHNTCTNSVDVATCDTTLTSIADCQTEEGCQPATNVCNTQQCLSQACVGSNSNAVLCCEITKENNCNNTVDNCISNNTCGNSKDICLETEYATCQTQFPCLITGPDCPETGRCVEPFTSNCDDETVLSGCVITGCVTTGCGD